MVSHSLSRRREEEDGPGRSPRQKTIRNKKKIEVKLCTVFQKKICVIIDEIERWIIEIIDI